MWQRIGEYYTYIMGRLITSITIIKNSEDKKARERDWRRGCNMYG
jgi:hypothetical protein